MTQRAASIGTSPFPSKGGGRPLTFQVSGSGAPGGDATVPQLPAVACSGNSQYWNSIVIGSR